MHKFGLNSDAQGVRFGSKADMCAAPSVAAKANSGRCPIHPFISVCGQTTTTCAPKVRGPYFHATRIDGANFSARDPPRRFFCRQSGFYQPNARRGA